MIQAKGQPQKVEGAGNGSSSRRSSLELALNAVPQAILRHDPELTPSLFNMLKDKVGA